MNLLMGALLLVTLSYFVPSNSRERNITRTEWVKTVKQDCKKVEAGLKPTTHLTSPKPAEFIHKIFCLQNRVEVSFKLNKSFHPAPFSARLTPAKVISNDDDYLRC